MIQFSMIANLVNFANLTPIVYLCVYESSVVLLKSKKERFLVLCQIDVTATLRTIRILRSGEQIPVYAAHNPNIGHAATPNNHPKFFIA